METLRECDFLGKELADIHKAIKAKSDAAAGEFELTSTQTEVLKFLIMHQGEEINQRDIEKSLNLKNPTVTGILKRMELKGFILRRADKYDKRYKQIILTEKSMELHRTVFSSIKDIEALLVQGFSRDEIKMLKRMLEKVLNNISDSF